jgi:hypothetical protein
LHKIKEPSSRLRVVWRQMTQLWKLTDLSTKIVISTQRQRTPFNKYQYHVQIVKDFWFLLLQKTAQLFGFSIFWLWAWKRGLWKLFQKGVVHTKLDMYFCIVKLKIQIEKLHIYALFWRIKLFFKEGLTWFEAQRCCASISGHLVTIDDQIVNCNNIPLGVKTLWTGNIRKPSEWIEFQGKLNAIERYIHKYFK